MGSVITGLVEVRGFAASGVYMGQCSPGLVWFRVWGFKLTFQIGRSSSLSLPLGF